MAVIVACPSCGDRLHIPQEFVGRMVRCASCSSTFEARETPSEQPPSSQPALEQHYSDRPLPGEPERPGDRFQECPEQRHPDRFVPGEPPREAPPLERRDDDYPPRDDYEGEEDLRRRYIRRDVLPHRGGLVLTLGIISIVAGTVGCVVCIWLSGVIGLGFGVTAVLMGRTDLRQMDAGTMDPDGRGLTKAGLICGIVGMVCGALAGLACGAYLIFVVYMMATHQ
jgi:hypothetical protein